MWSVVEMRKDGLFEMSRHNSKDEALNEKEDLISIWTHWNIEGCPCQKSFEVFEVA